MLYGPHTPCSECELDAACCTCPMLSRARLTWSSLSLTQHTTHCQPRILSTLSRLRSPLLVPLDLSISHTPIIVLSMPTGQIQVVFSLILLTSSLRCLIGLISLSAPQCPWPGSRLVGQRQIVRGVLDHGVLKWPPAAPASLSDFDRCSFPPVNRLASST
jgi:hypothetical protein